jgi:selenocysteine lyase
LSVGRDTTSKQIEQTVLMLKTAVNLLDWKIILLKYLK